MQNIKINLKVYRITLSSDTMLGLMNESMFNL